MKKLRILLTACALSFAMTACGDKNAGAEETSQENTQSTAQSAAETEPTQETGLSSTQEFQETEETGMDTVEGWSQEMTAVRDAIVDALGENYWPNMAITPQMLEDTFGIASDLYDDYMGEMPMISTNVDTLLIIKAKSDKVDEVEEALNTYRDHLVNDTMQYPMNMGKIQASRIERIGSYVCFVQLGADTTAASESGEEAVITHCQEQNELVIEIIGQNVER